MKLLEFTLEQNFEVVSVSTISAVIESVTFLVHHYITCSDKVMSRSGSDSSVGARACFGDSLPTSFAQVTQKPFVVK